MGYVTAQPDSHSRIAISNQRITRIDAVNRTVSFTLKEYKNDSRLRETAMTGKPRKTSGTKTSVAMFVKATVDLQPKQQQVKL
jgi:hypothetical protein